MLHHAQCLVYSLLALMPSVYQKRSLEAVLGMFLSAQGHALPEHPPIKSSSSLSRFFNRYRWPTRQVIRTTRAAVLEQLSKHPVPRSIPVRLLIDLTTLKKTGKFWHLSTPTEDIEAPSPWVRMLNGKRGLHLVVLYIIIGQRRIPWSFRVWRGKDQASPNRLACKLLASVPKSLVTGRVVIVQADTEFGTIEFFNAVKQRQWRAVVGVKNSRLLQDGRKLKDLPGNSNRGLQVYLEGIDYPLTVSWFWLNRADNKRELRFVASTHPYSGVYLVRLGRKRWAIEGFFKTAKHQFGLHCFGQGTKIGVYRWFILSLIAYLLAHWVDLWAWPYRLDWKATASLALEKLLPFVLWAKLLNQIKRNADIATHFGFEISIKSLSESAYRDRCKI
ncbi:MAG: transposase [Cyanobacteria bacterium P01_F01_bin.116]